MRSIREWQKIVHANALAKGFWDDVPETLSTEAILAKCALIHSETSEAVEDAREGNMTTVKSAKGKPEGFPSELADVIIRAMDLAEYMNIDLEKEIDEKHQYNVSRPYKHGKLA